jgi:hypothetical protein
MKSSRPQTVMMDPSSPAGPFQMMVSSRYPWINVTGSQGRHNRNHPMANLVWGEVITTRTIPYKTKTADTSWGMECSSMTADWSGKFWRP